MNEIKKQLKKELKKIFRPVYVVFKKGYDNLNEFLHFILLIKPIYELYIYLRHRFLATTVVFNLSRVYTFYYLLVLIMFIYCVLIYAYFDQYLFQSVKDTTRLEF
jgi:hypothetical protein